MNPPLRPESDEGYFEIIDGPANDVSYTITGGTTNFGSRYAPPSTGQSLFGDIDDVLMFTSRSSGEPFIGKLSTSPTGTTEPQSAEIIYFVVANGPVIDPTTTPPTRLCTLYRRVLLIAPGITSASSPAIPAASNNFCDLNDLSVRFSTTAGSTPTFMVANSMGDLTKRENRFAHYGTAYPGIFPFDVQTTVPAATATLAATQPNVDATLLPLNNAGRLGDDVLLTNVLAFDVQVFDPNAPIYTPAGIAVDPRDAGYSAQYHGTPVSYGAYVDLGFGIGYPSGPFPVFYNTPNGGIRPVLPAGGTLGLTPVLPVAAQNTVYGGSPFSTAYTYDTWSLHYENDGIAQNASHAADTGTNGLDDDGSGIVDDLPEFDTQPPFAAKLRGVRVTVRVYEPNSQQVREITVVQDFLPE